MSQASINYYTEERALLLAVERIEYPKDDKAYEHQVGTWAFTIISKHFSEDYLITPEKTDPLSKKRPDIVIEKFIENDKDSSKPHVVIELKKKGGDSFHKILDQIFTAIIETFHETELYQVFVVAQRGLEIAFFEYHQVGIALEPYGIENYKGFVPILQTHYKLYTRPEDKESRKTLDDMLKRMLDEKKNKMKNLAASNLKSLCVFDIREHGREIDTIFHHMARAKPREFMDTESD